MTLRRGELVLVPCRNGVKTAKIICEHIVEICEARKKILLNKNSVSPYEDRQKEFIEHSGKYGIKEILPEIKDFKDGEVSIKLPESVRGRDVYVVQNTLDPENPEKTSHNILELVLLVDTVKRSSANHITVVLPYLSYSKQERRQGRQPISVKVLLDILNDAGADKLITMDLHASAIEGFSGGNQMNIENLYASSAILDYLINKKHFKGTFVAPDAGAAKTVGHYAQVTGLPMAVGYKYKKPDSHHEFEEQKLLGTINDMDTTIVDDQIAGGSTVLNIAKSIKEKGGKDIYIAVTHGMLLGDAEKSFRDAVKNNTIKEVMITNTLIHSEDFFKRNEHITKLDALDFFAKSIFEAHVDGSISRLYQENLRKSMFGENHKTI